MKTIKLEDEIEFIYGKSLPANNRIEGNFPVYGSNGIVGFHNEFCFTGPGIIIGRKGTVGAIKLCKSNFWAIDTTYKLDMKKEDDCLSYWYYLLHTLNLDKMNTHSAVPGLNRQAVYLQEIRVHEDIKDRIAIAHILSTLDDKIEVNNQINKTLENMAQAIFKQWFVDFEFPNEEGEPYKSSGGEMVDSELGMIPKGWRKGLLEDIIEITSGKRPGKRSDSVIEDCTYPLVGASSVMGYTNSFNFNEKILVIGRVGTHGVIQRFNHEVWASDNTLVIKSENYEFTYQILNQIDYNVINRGSTQPLITQTDIKNYSLIIPSEYDLLKFEKIVKSLFEVHQNNVKEIKWLIKLRDTLLPKLMSGEIRVPLES